MFYECIINTILVHMNITKKFYCLLHFGYVYNSVCTIGKKSWNYIVEHEMSVLYDTRLIFCPPEILSSK